MALKNLFVRDTRIIISWEERYAKIQLVYNDLVAPIKTIVEHWERFEMLKKYFTDDNASYAIINPSQFTEAMKSVEDLKAEYGANKKMCFIIDDTVQNMKALEAAPEGFIIKYNLSGSDLIRELPAQATECDDGWSVWKNSFIWHLPKLSAQDLKGFRRAKITREELIKFLQEDLPKYREAGQETECDIGITDENACTIDIGRVERDSIHLTVNWTVPLDSIDPEFDMFGYILSNNTVYSGLNPLEIEQHCPNVSGRNGLSFNKIAAFLDNAYPRWKPWITGNKEQFEAMHRWLTPPFYSFLKVNTKETNGIGQAYGKPYILIGNECLSSTIVKQALASDYYHLREGWIRSKDLKSAINSKIVEDPDSAMNIVELDQHQILHSGDSVLKEKWQDIFVDENIQWYAGGTKPSIASAHFDYLIKWGVDGGISGGYETFMSYGLPYLIQFLKVNEIKPVILIDSEYKASISTILESVPILDKSNAEVYTYNHLSECKLYNPRICIVIEPAASASEEITTIMDTCEICLFFPKQHPTQYNEEEKALMARLLGTEHDDDLNYLIRSVNGVLNPPAFTSFPENLHLATRQLVFHEDSINLD